MTSPLKIEKFESLKVSTMGLTETDCKCYDQIFHLLDVHHTGLIAYGQSPITSLFQRAGITNGVAEKIWGLADPYEKKVLDKQGLYVALRLICCAQNECPVSYPALTIHHDLPLPKIKGFQFDPTFIPPPPTTSPSAPATPLSPAPSSSTPLAASPLPEAPGGHFFPGTPRIDIKAEASGYVPASTPTPRGGASPIPTAVSPGDPASVGSREVGSPGLGSSGAPPPPLCTIPLPEEFKFPSMPAFDSIQWPPPPPPLSEMDKMWMMTDAELKDYKEIFRLYDSDNDGFMTGEEARAFFGKFSVERKVLKHLWAISDTDRDGQLSQTEFCIFYHLITGVTARLCIVPDTLPRILDPKHADARNPLTQLIRVFEEEKTTKQIMDEKLIEQRRQHLELIAEMALKNPQVKFRLEEVYLEKLESVRQEIKKTQEKLQEVQQELRSDEAILEESGIKASEELRSLDSMRQDNLQSVAWSTQSESELEKKRELIKRSESYLEQVQEATAQMRLKIQESEMENELLQEEIETQRQLLNDMAELRENQRILLLARIQKLPESTRKSLGF